MVLPPLAHIDLDAAAAGNAIDTGSIRSIVTGASCYDEESSPGAGSQMVTNSVAGSP